MKQLVEALFAPCTWLIAVITILSFILLVRLSLDAKLILALPNGSPKHWAAYHLPLLGSALPFFRRRRDMLAEGQGLVTNGNFSFFIGSKHIVNLGSLQGRRTFFESKNLSVSQGAIELLVGLVSANDDLEDSAAQDFIKSLLPLTRPAMLASKISVLTDDIHLFCRNLLLSTPSESRPNWRVMNPFESVYFLTSKLIMRVIGVSEWAEDEKLMNHIISCFYKFENNCSRARIVFPGLVTYTHLKKLFYGALLWRGITEVVQQRKAGKRRDDAVQFVLDQDKDAIRFTFSILSSGITTEGCSASWLTVFLAHSPEWQAKCRAEVHGVIAQKRGTSSQSADSILGKLSLEEWEGSFPVIMAAIRETVRLAMPGAMVRKNASGSAVSIGQTSEVIPDGAYACFLIDNVHMDPGLYPDPYGFNPERYLVRKSGLEEPEPHTYVGWGSGRHLCPGMRLAKLEISMVIAHLLAHFEFEPSDGKGCKLREPLPLVDRNEYRLKKPKGTVYIRYRPRE
ncbi:cytochrome P450 [Metarhizium robertsii]|uniref:Cytochrome P450 n=2 Tax=Metarhizium robertsii TaxID=568076 RepID=A0A0B2XF99_METRA|nr:uncharacterized protein MAA_11698 [Metarhizium robertsii ARSEF 23]EXU99416.1 cytochrome P450 [Metarhizium robertsii]KHO10694.1 hypothetical protein MAA_11698 [Metarhizium robertsii ARSEF 23]